MKNRIIIMAFIILLSLVFCSCKSAETEIEMIAASSDEVAGNQHISENAKEQQEEWKDENSLLYSSIYFQYDGAAGEAIEDMYRPEGYSDRIGSVLALKMAFHDDDSQYLYHVVLDVPSAYHVEEMLSSVSQQIREEQDRWTELRDPLVDAIIECTGKSEQEAFKCLDRLKLNVGTYFYYIFTAEQIKELAEAGFGCSYVGSGGGELPDIDWKNKEYVEAFCEKYGDSITAVYDDAVSFESYWDIKIVDGEIVSIDFCV